MLHVVCVDAGNYLERGAEYVAKLFAGVSHNSRTPFKFNCFTDRYERDDLYPAGVNLKPTVTDGWYNKLYLFKPGLFPDGEQILFLDLDTVITGNIDDLMAYRGDFAILRDFLKPERYGPAIMSWKAGTCPELWTDWDGEHLVLGDLTFINDIFRRDKFKPDVLQDLFGGIYSYKKDCHLGLPADARVVCYHGKPRPHEVNAEWMRRYWHG